MKTKLLVVMPMGPLNYLHDYEPVAVRSYAEARLLIEGYETAQTPFDALDLSVADERAFWSFVDWMKRTGRKYPFSVFGVNDVDRFVRIRDRARAMGFDFRD